MSTTVAAPSANCIDGVMTRSVGAVLMRKSTSSICIMLFGIMSFFATLFYVGMGRTKTKSLQHPIHKIHHQIGQSATVRSYEPLTASAVLDRAARLTEVSGHRVVTRVLHKREDAQARHRQALFYRSMPTLPPDSSDSILSKSGGPDRWSLNPCPVRRHGTVGSASDPQPASPGTGGSGAGPRAMGSRAQPRCLDHKVRYRLQPGECRP